MPHAAPQRILFIDAYDSFTNNIVSLLETRLHVSVTVVKIDEPVNDLIQFLTNFTAVIAGPGPGDPRNAKDVGLYEDLWNLETEDLLPVLGICLGFQSLVLAFGGTIQRLPEPRHGIVRCVASNGKSMFKGVRQLKTVQYHSLHATLGHSSTSNYDDLWQPSPACPNLQPLAWDFEADNVRDTMLEKSLEAPGRVLMAVHHTVKPFYGVQFHAESICSSENAHRVIDSWWAAARTWQRPLPLTHNDLNIEDQQKSGISCTKMKDRARATWNYDSYVPSWQRSAIHNQVNSPRNRARTDQDNHRSPISLARVRPGKMKTQVLSSVIDNGLWSIPNISDALGLGVGDSVILDSERAQGHELANYSIIGFVSPASLRFEHNITTCVCSKTENGKRSTVCLARYSNDVFAFFKEFLKDYRMSCEHTQIPFWGGLVGYISYEACLNTIGVSKDAGKPGQELPQRPDLSFVFVERSLVIDHAQRKIYILSIKPDDNKWLDTTATQLSPTACDLFLRRHHNRNLRMKDPTPMLHQISLPEETAYKSKIRACQDSIRAGDSYELCLTTQATIRTALKQSSWPLYEKLRQLNPAPFAAYIRLGKLALLSSSPERFLSWSRPNRTTIGADWHNEKLNDKISKCQFRPIKGTVKKFTGDEHHPYLTMREATEVLSTTKERAENLMIVDLIRHDLHGVVGSGNVTVSKLMVVEEYATVFQLVSVIEGNLVVDDSDDEEDLENDTIFSETSSDCSTGESSSSQQYDPSNSDEGKFTSAKDHSKTGIDVLAASLPPGSMTGAPKLRSCQILQQVEDRQRGVYSGVVGYMDVGGSGDFSVVIRSAVHWDRDSADRDTANSHNQPRGEARNRSENEKEDDNEWTIGAGGAVTSLSTEDGEWEEMLTKLRSTLRVFE